MGPGPTDDASLKPLEEAVECPSEPLGGAEKLAFKRSPRVRSDDFKNSCNDWSKTEESRSDWSKLWRKLESDWRNEVMILAISDSMGKRSKIKMAAKHSFAAVGAQLQPRIKSFAD